jgi:hypothetical protein
MCGARRSSGDPAACVWRATILAMSRVPSGRGGWPVRGSDSSGCRSRPPGGLLPMRRSRRARPRRVESLGCGHACRSGSPPPAGRSRDCRRQARVACSLALSDVGDQQVGGFGAGGRQSRASAVVSGRACLCACARPASAAVVRTALQRGRAAHRGRRFDSGHSGSPGQRRALGHAGARDDGLQLLGHGRKGAAPPGHAGNCPSRHSRFSRLVWRCLRW